MADTELTTDQEAALMDQHGRALWAAMEQIVDASPFYAGVNPRERCACIARLALQAVLGPMNDAAPPGDAPYVVLSGCGRIVGQVTAQAPDLAAEMGWMRLLAQEIAYGARDMKIALKEAGHG